MVNLFIGRKNTVHRNVLVLVSGTSGAHLLALLFMPLITRIYDAEAFGILGIFTALISITAPIAALTYPASMILTNSRRVAIAITQLSLCMGLMICGLILLILLLSKSYLIEKVGSEFGLIFIIMIPISISLAVLLQINQYWLMRDGLFNSLAKISFSHSLIVNLSKVGIGLVLTASGIALIIITALGTLIQIILSKRSILEWKYSDLLNINQKNILAASRKFKDFPLFRAPQILINNVSQAFPLIFISVFFGVATAGLYALARTILQVPVTLVGKSLSDVIYPKFSKMKNSTDDIRHLIMKTTAVLFLISFIPFGTVILWGPALFEMIFGDGWRDAGVMAQWISIWLITIFINRPTISAIPVLGMQKRYLQFTLIVFFMRALGLWCGYYFFNDAISAIALFSIKSAIFNLFIIIYVQRYKRN